MLKFGVTGVGVGVGEALGFSPTAKLEQLIKNAIDTSNNIEIIVLVFNTG
jgi:hypothetical protein